MDQEQEQLMEDKTLLRLARFVSALFTPLTIPLLSFVALFLFSYLRITTIQYKVLVLGVVTCFTIVTPLLTYFLFRKLHKLTHQELTEKEKRYMPIMLVIISYAFCFLTMMQWHLHWFLCGIILVCLILSVICILLNFKWKLSEHMAGAGSIVGGILSFSALLGYNPIFWLCFFILIAGFLGTSRILLGKHTLGEVLVGFSLGLVCSFLVLHPAYNHFVFRLFLY